MSFAPSTIGDPLDAWAGDEMDDSCSSVCNAAREVSIQSSPNHTSIFHRFRKGNDTTGDAIVLVVVTEYHRMLKGRLLNVRVHWRAVYWEREVFANTLSTRCPRTRRTVMETIYVHSIQQLYQFQVLNVEVALV